MYLFLMLMGGKKQPPVPQTVTVPAPTAGVYLRSGFDTDPSAFLGRFLPAGQPEVDESNGMTTRCSALVSYRKVGGGGVTYIEQVTVSTAVAARLGVPLVASVEGGVARTSSVRVQYKLLNKLVADIPDPVAFESCCKAAPDQCTDRYISEFYEGVGSVQYAKATAVHGKVKGVVQTVAVGAEASRGVEWVQSTSFDQPVYFAFKTSPNAFAGAGAAPCGSWMDAPPKSTQGSYFVGVSPPAPTEAAAREAALRDARLQTVAWAQTAIQAGSLTVELDEAGRAGLLQRLSETRTLETASAGVASLVKDESWCITPQATPDGTMVTAKVLAFLPASEHGQAARILSALASP
jgi:hypothetical protein